jgi:hypothetical protein
MITSYLIIFLLISNNNNSHYYFNNINTSNIYKTISTPAPKTRNELGKAAEDAGHSILSETVKY